MAETVAASLQWRLWHRLLLIVAGGAAAGAAALGGLWYETAELLDAELRRSASRLLPLAEAPTTFGEATAAAWPPGEHDAYSGFQLLDRSGHVLLRSPGAPKEPMDLFGAEGLRNVGPWRVLVLDATDGSRRILVAEAIGHRHEALWHTARWMVALLIVGLVLGALGLRITLGRVLAAAESAGRAIGALDVQALKPLRIRGLPPELAPWLDNTNALLARMRALVEAERAFTANAAHELRRPLAAARAQAQRLQSTSGDGVARQHAGAIVQQLDGLARLATRLLQLCRTDAAPTPLGRPVDLGEVAALVVAEFHAPQRDGRLRLRADGDQPATTSDAEGVGIALRNLVENALRHGGPDAHVIVEVTPDMLAVEDDGPGVHAEHLARLPRRFARGAAAAAGDGLGLALADAIMRRNGASLRLRSPVRDGRGFRAELLFERAISAAP